VPSFNSSRRVLFGSVFMVCAGMCSAFYIPRIYAVPCVYVQVACSQPCKHVPNDTLCLEIKQTSDTSMLAADECTKRTVLEVKNSSCGKYFTGTWNANTQSCSLCDHPLQDAAGQIISTNCTVNP
jgi:hypothetical protein